MKETNEELSSKIAFLEAGGKNTSIDSYQIKDRQNKKTLIEGEISSKKEARKKTRVNEIIKKYDIWNTNRMQIIDTALKFIIDNIIPDYLKYEF